MSASPISEKELGEERQVLSEGGEKEAGMHEACYVPLEGGG